MQNLTQPTLLLKPFCQDGDKNQIPVQNDSLVDPQLADLTNGFPEITSKPPSQGGLPPERRDFNALGYLTTSYDWFYQAGGTFTFNQTISNSIGGYPLNARLWYLDENGVSCILRSTIPNNTNNFLLDSSVIGDTGSGKPWEIENFRGISVKGFTLFETKWSDHIINDISWLRSDTFSWQSGLVYTAAYNHLANDYTNGTSTTETVGSYTITYVLAEDGHKITTDEATVLNIYNATGVAWYYILDTTNQRFKLPRENPAREELIQVIRAKGNGKSLGIYDGSVSLGLKQGSSSGGLFATTTAYNVNIGITTGSGGTTTAEVALGLNTDSTKSNVISDMKDSISVYKGKKYLYFYVGQFTQTAIEQTAGLNSEMFNGKVDVSSLSECSVVIETYSNGTDWYRLYSDGWIEQGGQTADSSSVTVNLLKPMENNQYSVQLTCINKSQGDQNWVARDKTTTSFLYSNSESFSVNWEVKGWSAQ